MRRKKSESDTWEEDEIEDVGVVVSSDVGRVDVHKGIFNKALPFLTHLQSLELICSESNINNDYVKWFDTLNSWFNKLSGKLQRTDAVLLSEIDGLFVAYERFITDEAYPVVFKRRMLNFLQRKLEKITDDFGYQMPEQGGGVDDKLEF